LKHYCLIDVLQSPADNAVEEGVIDSASWKIAGSLWGPRQSFGGDEEEGPDIVVYNISLRIDIIIEALSLDRCPPKVALRLP